MKKIFIKPGIINVSETNLTDLITQVIAANGYPTNISCCSINTATNGQVLAYDTPTKSWIPTTVAGVGGVANLSYTASPTNGVVTNSSGTGFTIPLVTSTNAGLMSSAQFTATQSPDGNTYTQMTNGVMNFFVNGIQVMSLSNTKLSLNSLLIDPPTGLELMLMSTNPGGIKPNTLWLNSVNNHLYRGSIDLENQTINASQVITTPSGSLSSTTLATTLNELDTEKQATLISGTNIKTINGQSVLGSGNIVISTSGVSDTTPTSGSTNDITSGGVFTALSSLTTSTVTEGSNLYFTEPRVLSTKLTGYVSGAGFITSVDSVLQAIQKLDGNMVANDAAYVHKTGTETISGVKDFATQPTGIKASSILLDPIVGMSAVNLQEAVQELFTMFVDAFNQPI